MCVDDFIFLSGYNIHLLARFFFFLIECMGTILSRCVSRGRVGSEEPVPSESRRKGDAHAFSNGINALLITCPERKIYLSSPRICDQGISASVLLRDEN